MSFLSLTKLSSFEDKEKRGDDVLHSLKGRVLILPLEEGSHVLPHAGKKGMFILPPRNEMMLSFMQRKERDDA